MSSLPLEVHEVLEQEYVSLHGPIDVPSSDYRPDDILDETWARSILAICKIDVGADVPAALNELVAKGGFERLRESPVITECGLDLINGYDDYADGVTDARRREINRRIVDDAFQGTVKQWRDVRLAAHFARLHALPAAKAQTALCISGGGIRTATFAFGVMQGLAGARILDKFHYLSTVSGGGFIGSWLSSWARRHPGGIAGVQDDLIRADNAVEGTKPGVSKTDLPKAKIDPEPRPIRHLRDYSNYLSPKLGFLSADTWTMASLYIRNLLLNLLILIPILAALLAIPRLFATLVRADAGFTPSALLLVTAAALAVGFGYLGLSRPTVHGRHASAMSFRGNGGYAVFCVLPLTVAAVALSLYWVKIAESPSFKDVVVRDWMLFAAAGVAMTLLPAAIYYFRFFVQSSAASRREPLQRQYGAWKKLSVELVATIAGLASVGALIYLLAAKAFDHPLREVLDLTAVPPFVRGLLDSTPISEIYVCFAVPLVLLVFFVQNAVFVGFSGKVNEDYDREWWGRGGALVLMTAVLLAAGSFIAVFGPVLLYKAPVILGSLGGVSGIVAGLLGFSAKTPAADKSGEKGAGSAASGMAMAFVVPLFVVFLLAAISLGTTVLIQLIRHQNVSVTTKWAEQFQSNLTFTQSIEPAAGAKIETRYETEKTPYLSLATVNGVEHLETVHATDHWDLIGIAAVAIVAALLSMLIGVNRFSMHGLYRNRIIRAYLGASRYNRDPDPFTGFDPHDNLQMYELRPELLWPTSFLDLGAFIAQLKANITKPGSVELTIWNALDSQTRQWLENDRPVSDALRNALTQNVNNILITEDLGGGVVGEPAVSRLCRNRASLQTAFGSLLRPERHAPMHVINTTLNLTSGDKLAWQQRKAESFTVSPLHSGSAYLGYRDSKEYAGKDGISVGTAVAISGAAASPNMGYSSSPAMAFLLTILNVRLGSWLGNPGTLGKTSYQKANPVSNLHPLTLELTGMSNDQSSLVYLSDGGHFENLALYEMVLRRCRYIVVSDGGCDPTFSFDDLGNAIRKIRTDLGIPIDIRHMYMFPRQPGAAFPEGRYVATARIRYSAIDQKPDGVKDIDGTLVYIKPGLYSENYFPKDVYNYATSSPDFPHESTADQFFSESQFESYRALGRHAINEICGNYDEKAESPRPPLAATFATVADFAAAVESKAARDETFDIRIDKKTAAALTPTVMVQATPSARLVIRD